ncbi:uncharacterized protein JCM6883_002674 [Sporobolomyces salmoneus]|uniref:uncharacterized protein n=1 Tax=Sporobolomyces salmoneus TaxID=183962 RepID=UPI0031813BB8
MSPPAYESIPQEKPPLRSQDLASAETAEQLVEHPSPKSTSPLRILLKTLLYTVLLVFTCSICLLSGAFIGDGLAELVKPQQAGHRGVKTVTEYVTVTEKGSWKWWNKRTEVAGEGDGYSTSTLRDGSTQTFVFTTRPIVNPGGYTIGTLTGYVPVSSTTSDAGPTTTIPSAEPTSSTRSASTIPNASATSSNLQPSSLPSATSTSDSWSRVSTTSLPQPTPTPSPSSEEEVVEAPSTTSEAFDFSEVDYHLLHRRGLDFEDPATQAEAQKEEPESPSSTITSLPIPTTTGSGSGGAEEFSTSTDRQGSVHTLVKTTRAIVNPGGYTIGTLDGGWVDPNLIRPTKRATSHEELRKRESINL